MVVHCAGDEARDLSVPSRHRETLTRQARNLPLDSILAGLDVLSATRSRLRDSSHARTLVEMALVRLGRLGELLSVAQLAQQLGQLPPGNAPLAPSAGGTAPRLVSPPEGVKKNHPGPTPDQSARTGPVSLTPETLPEIWAQVLQSTGVLLASDLRLAGLPAIFGPNALALRFPAEYNQAKEHCQEPARVTRIEDALRKILGRPCTVRIEGVIRSPGSAPVAPGTGQRPVPHLDGNSAAAPVGSAPRRNPREEAEKEPLVKRAVDVLGAQVVRVDGGFGAQTSGTERTEAAVVEDT
jgi:DNA polymerase-3 subunit gamma/tau